MGREEKRRKKRVKGSLEAEEHPGL